MLIFMFEKSKGLGSTLKWLDVSIKDTLKEN